MLELGFAFLHVVFVLLLGYYTITAMQWYSYKIKRVIFHYNKPLWHLFFFIIPIGAYYFLGVYFWAYFAFAFVPSLYMWYKKLDKPLVFTDRVKRFFFFLLVATIFQDILCLAVGKCFIFGVFMPLVFSLLASFLFEKMMFLNYQKRAESKLESIDELSVVTITASYGKTSIKNFLYEILKESHKVYKTPRSVNTLGGLIKDINDDLPEDTQVYITEAGAREKGDIAQIASLLKPQIAIVGQIGEQHIEYFKTLENIRDTKMELLGSKRLEYAYVHESANVKPDAKTTIFGHDVVKVEANLDGTTFFLRLNGIEERFFTPLLGKFNAVNLAVCVHVALKFGLSLDEIRTKIASLESVEHRLKRIDAGGKVILDDSFNGNFEGMSASYELVDTYKGRKVLVTPGIIESTKEENKKLGLIMNDIFDIVILTGSLNTSVLASVLKKPEVVFLKDKNKMQEVLAEHTMKGDIILFSNDAPGFI